MSDVQNYLDAVYRQEQDTKNYLQAVYDKEQADVRNYLDALHQDELRKDRERTQRQADEEKARKERRNISSSVQALLSEFLDPTEVKSLSRLINQLIEDDASEDEIMLKVRESKVWKDRFKGNEIRKQNGLAVLSPQEYLDYERRSRQLMAEAKMPPGFYDKRDDFHELIGKDISINELTRRVQNGYVKVMNAPQEIRSAFAQYFGANGDSALASMFLDYNKAIDVLERNVAAATFGGTAKRFGFDPTYARADQAASLGIDQGRAEQGFGQVLEMKPLFDETADETADFTAEEQGFGSVFGFDSVSSEKIRRRREQRIARGAGSTEGALSTQQGVVGLSRAR